MACPYFIPDEICPAELWPHRRRLPLGEGFMGRCAANGGAQCGEQELRLHCNLGYADIGYANLGSAGCRHLPAERAFDAARVDVVAEGQILRVRYACERRHLPVSVGELRYDVASEAWSADSAAPDALVLRLAEAAARGWLAHDRQRNLRQPQ